MLTAKIGSILWGRMSLLQQFSTATAQSLRLLDMAGEYGERKLEGVHFRVILFTGLPFSLQIQL